MLTTKCDRIVIRNRQRHRVISLGGDRFQLARAAASDGVLPNGLGMVLPAGAWIFQRARATIGDGAE